MQEELKEALREELRWDLRDWIFYRQNPRASDYEPIHIRDFKFQSILNESRSYIKAKVVS